jgi:hypothetical protein
MPIGRYTKAFVMTNLVAAVSIALVTLLGECGFASAEQKVDGKTTQELKKVDTVPPATGKNQSDQAGTQEPSTKGKGHDSNADVFVNGVLAVPDAATDGQTVPSKYSARNSNIDKLSIVSLKLFYLTDAQRQEIYGLLHTGAGGLALNPAYATVGAEIPADIALRDIKPTPNGVAAKFSELRGTSYLTVGRHVLLIGTNNVVIGLSAP